MKWEDEPLLKEFRGQHWCAYCGATGNTAAHHIFGKGAGRVDWRKNLFRVGLGCVCHQTLQRGRLPDRRDADTDETRLELLKLTCARDRDGWCAEDVLLVFYKIRAMPQPVVPYTRDTFEALTLELRDTL